MGFTTPHLNWTPLKCSCKFSDSRITHRYRCMTAHAVNKHQKQLVDQVLQNQAGIPQAVLQGVQAISSSADWHQLQAAFTTSTAQLRSAAAVAVAAAQSTRGQQQPPQHQQRGSGGSPWGFALRQPGSRRPAAPAPTLNLTSTSSSSHQPIFQPEGQSPSPPSQHNSPEVHVQQGKGQEPSWQLEGAQQLVVLGLGSISALLPSSSSSSSSQVRHV